MQENDDFDEDDVETVRATVRRALEGAINDITNSVARVNPIPETDEITVDQDALFWELLGDLFSRLDPGFWFSNTIGLLWGGSDEHVGMVLQKFDHTTIGDGRGFSVQRTGENNTWVLSGRIENLSD